MVIDQNKSKGSQLLFCVHSEVKERTIKVSVVNDVRETER